MSELFGMSGLQAPEHFKGPQLKGNGFSKTEPREWTPAEVQWCLEQRAAGFSVREIALALDRSYVSVRMKMTRQMKKDDTYSAVYRNDKHAANLELIQATQATTALDVYAGDSWWAKHIERTTTNDIDEKFDTHHHMDAFQFLAWMITEQTRYDIVDLDPFGSPYDCLDLAMKIAKRGIAVSFGEWGMKRWGRTDYVRPRYGITELEDFQAGEPFIEEVQRIANCNSMTATPITVLRYGNFLRVGFTLEKKKTIEQWIKQTKGQNK